MRRWREGRQRRRIVGAAAPRAISTVGVAESEGVGHVGAGNALVGACMLVF